MGKIFGNKKEMENLKNEYELKIENEKELHNKELLELKEDYNNKLNKATENYKTAVNHKDDKIKEISDLLHSVPVDINGEVIEFKDFILNKTGSVNSNISNQSAVQEENSASIQNIAESVRNIASKLLMSVDIAKEDSKNVEKLCNNIQSIVTQMNELNKSIDKITAFTNTINNISSQTNLLSINARIESAKAGEYGKGFAVVADEINKLAMQSKEASDYIADSIKDITTNSELMHGVIDDCSKASESLLESSKTSNNNINSINEEIITIESNITDASAGNQEITATLQVTAQDVNEIYEDESIAPNKPIFEIKGEINKVVANKDFGTGGYKMEFGEGIAIVTCDGLIRGHIAGEFFKDYNELKRQVGNLSKTTIIMDLRSFGVFANNKESRQAVAEVYRNYTEFGKVVAVIGQNALIKMQLVNVLKSINLLEKYTFVDRYTISRY